MPLGNRSHRDFFVLHFLCFFFRSGGGAIHPLLVKLEPDFERQLLRATRPSNFKPMR